MLRTSGLECPDLKSKGGSGCAGWAGRKRLGRDYEPVRKLALDGIEAPATGDQRQRLVAGRRHDRRIGWRHQLHVHDSVVVLALLVVPDLDLVVQADLVQKAEDIALVQGDHMPGDNGIAAAPDQRRKVAVVDSYKRQRLPRRMASRIRDDATLFDDGI